MPFPFFWKKRRCCIPHHVASRGSHSPTNEPFMHCSHKLHHCAPQRLKRVRADRNINSQTCGRGTRMDARSTLRLQEIHSRSRQIPMTFNPNHCASRRSPCNKESELQGLQTPISVHCCETGGARGRIAQARHNMTNGTPNGLPPPLISPDAPQRNAAEQQQRLQNLGNAHPLHDCNARILATTQQSIQKHPSIQGPTYYEAAAATQKTLFPDRACPNYYSSPSPQRLADNHPVCARPSGKPKPQKMYTPNTEAEPPLRHRREPVRSSRLGGKKAFSAKPACSQPLWSSPHIDPVALCTLYASNRRFRRWFSSRGRTARLLCPQRHSGGVSMPGLDGNGNAVVHANQKERHLPIPHILNQASSRINVHEKAVADNPCKSCTLRKPIEWNRTTKALHRQRGACLRGTHPQCTQRTMSTTEALSTQHPSDSLTSSVRNSCRKPASAERAMASDNDVVKESSVVVCKNSCKTCGQHRGCASPARVNKGFGCISQPAYKAINGVNKPVVRMARCTCDDECMLSEGSGRATEKKSTCARNNIVCHSCAQERCCSVSVQNQPSSLNCSKTTTKVRREPAREVSSCTTCRRNFPPPQTFVEVHAAPQTPQILPLPATQQHFNFFAPAPPACNHLGTLSNMSAHPVAPVSPLPAHPNNAWHSPTAKSAAKAGANHVCSEWWGYQPFYKHGAQQHLRPQPQHQLIEHQNPVHGYQMQLPQNDSTDTFPNGLDGSLLQRDVFTQQPLEAAAVEAGFLHDTSEEEIAYESSCRDCCDHENSDEEQYEDTDWDSQWENAEGAEENVNYQLTYD